MMQKLPHRIQSTAATSGRVSTPPATGGGLRSNLSEHGIDVGLRLSQYWQRVATGGKTQNDEYGGSMDYRVNVDGGKLFGAQGWSLNIHTRTRFGEDISADVGAFVLENAGMLMPIPGDYHDTDVTGLMVTKAFPLGGKHIAAISVGKIDVIDTATGFFPGLGYGQEGFWNANSSITALPWFGAVAGLSLYGGYMVTLNTEYGMLPQSGLLVTGTENVSDNWGSVSDSFDDVWVAGFHRFLWKMDDKPGFFMMFGGYSTREQPSNDPLDFIGVPGQGIVSTDEGNPWDLALYLTQDLWHAEGNPQRKLVFLAGGTLGPDNPQFAQWNFFANVEAHGVMNSRPNDSMGVAFHRNALSDNFIEIVSPVIELQDTWGFEFYYNIAINQWLHLTADVQFIETEVKNNDFALIPGIRLVIEL
jgi:porin